jgi:hypothetical protein
MISFDKLKDKNIAAPSVHSSFFVLVLNYEIAYPYMPCGSVHSSMSIGHMLERVLAPNDLKSGFFIPNLLCISVIDVSRVYTCNRCLHNKYIHTHHKGRCCL